MGAAPDVDHDQDERPISTVSDPPRGRSGVSGSSRRLAGMRAPAPGRAGAVEGKDRVGAAYTPGSSMEHAGVTAPGILSLVASVSAWFMAPSDSAPESRQGAQVCPGAATARRRARCSLPVREPLRTDARLRDLGPQGPGRRVPSRRDPAADQPRRHRYGGKTARVIERTHGWDSSSLRCILRNPHTRAARQSTHGMVLLSVRRRR
jgi:hypothetical protein